MKGSNTLILCQSEIIAGLQYYFDNKLFTDKVKIKSIHSSHANGSEIYSLELIDMESEDPSLKERL